MYRLEILLSLQLCIESAECSMSLSLFRFDYDLTHNTGSGDLWRNCSLRLFLFSYLDILCTFSGLSQQHPFSACQSNTQIKVLCLQLVISVNLAGKPTVFCLPTFNFCILIYQQFLSLYLFPLKALKALEARSSISHHQDSHIAVSPSFGCCDPHAQPFRGSLILPVVSSYHRARIRPTVVTVQYCRFTGSWTAC